MKALRWIGRGFREAGFARSVRLVVLVVAVVLSVTATIAIHCEGGDRRFLPSADVIGWATEHAHDKARDALLLEIDLHAVAPDGTVDTVNARAANSEIATGRFRAPSLGAPRCELDVDVRGWKSTGLRRREPFQAEFGHGCAAPTARPPTCDAATIWQRAIHDGAPATGEAELDYAPPVPDSWTPVAYDTDQPIPGRWRFTHGAFARTYDDDCGGGAGEPRAATPKLHATIAARVESELALRGGGCVASDEPGYAALARARIHLVLAPDGALRASRVTILDASGAELTSSAAAAAGACLGKVLGESHLAAPGAPTVDDVELELRALH